MVVKMMSKKLSEDLKDWRAERPDEYTMDRFIRLAEKLEKPPWISVEDRLPREQGYYLVIAPKSFPKNCEAVVTEFYEDNHLFYSEAFEEPLLDATHWMKIPEPPKE